MFKAARKVLVSPLRSSRFVRVRSRSTWRPTFDHLEDRLAPATFTVLNANDTGAGSLRQAILDAAGNSQADLIQFDAGLAGQTITLATNDANFGFGPTGIVVNDTITLDGGGAPGLRISGGNARRVFAVSAGGSLTLPTPSTWAAPR